MQAAFQHDFKMFPDFHWTVEDSVITNDKIVARFRMTATHDHPVQFASGAPLLPPTGRKRGFRSGASPTASFVEHWDVDDLLGVIQQMRAHPAALAK